MQGISYAARYGAVGALFGACFPIAATAVILATNSVGWSLAVIAQAQSTEPLVWMIDTAPFFLGLAGYFAGIKQDEALRTLDALEEKVRDRTKILESERAEARRAAAEQGLAAGRFAGILQNSVDSIVLIDDKGTIELANYATEAMFGYAADKLIGENVSKLMPEPHHSRHDGYLERYLATGEARIIGRGRRVDGLRQDGTTFPLDLSISEHQTGDHVTFLGMMRDMTAEVRLTRERERRELEATLLHRATSMASETTVVDVALEHCAKAVCELTGWPVGHVYARAPDDPDLLVPTTIWSLSDEEAFRRFVDATAKTPFRRGEGLPGRILESAKPAWIVDVHRDDNFPRARHLGGIEVKGAFGFPIIVEGDVFAVLEFFSHTEMQEDQSLLRILENVGAQIGRVLEKTRAREALLVAKEEAEIANRTKTNFLANMSHELRTPLNATIGFTRVVLKNKHGNLSNKDVNYLERVHANGLHLLNLINEILDIAKVESGQMALALAPCIVDELVGNVAQLQESLVKERGLELRVELPDSLDPVIADQMRLKQALINLVGNAAKFTDTGHVTIRARTYPQTASLSCIEIQDSGVGIPADQLDMVFEPFRQVDDSSKRQHGGTGLGLTLTKRFCDSMGFSLSVESAEGEGSTFRIDVPRAKSLPAPAGEEPIGDDAAQRTADELRGSSGRTRRVLLIDDDDDARALVTELLDEYTCEVRCAEDGAEGLRIANEWLPDLILLDLMMPVMDGWEVLAELRASPQLEQASVVVVVSAVGDANRGRLSGIATIQKPLDRDTVQLLLGPPSADLFAETRADPS